MAGYNRRVNRDRFHGVNRTPQEMSEDKDRRASEFASLNNIMLRELNVMSEPIMVSDKYAKDDIRRYIANPKMFESALRNVSRGLYHQSSHYWRLIQYWANLLTYDYVLMPYGTPQNFSKLNQTTILSSYNKALSLVEKMNLKHEMAKIALTVMREDVYYGYEYSTKDSYSIQKLDPNYCQISSEEDGVYNFAFDFTFFDTRKTQLKLYAEEFQSKYNLYTTDKRKYRWQELDSKYTVCFKFNEDEHRYAFPPFAGVFEDILDITEYKMLRRVNERIGNYKIVVGKVPMRKDAQDANDYLISLDHVKVWQQKLENAVPEEVGVATVPFDIDSISFDRDKSNVDAVAQAVRNLMDGAGVSQVLFNAEKSGSVGLSTSVQVDESMMFRFLKQVERWVNRKLKLIGGAYRFKVVMPEITRFNRKEMFELYLKGAQTGVIPRTMVAATVGIAANDLINMTTLEIDILGLDLKLKPLLSSHTQTGEGGDGGRPEKDTKELSEEGAKTRDKDKNPNRAQ